MAHFGTALFQWSDHNLLAYSEDFSQWTQTNSPTLSSGQGDPFGGMEAYLIEDDSVTQTERIQLTIDAGTHNTNGAKSFSVYMKAGTSTASGIYYVGSTSGINRLLASVHWDSSGPAVTMTTGTLLWHRQFLDGWWHLGFQTTTDVGSTEGHLVYLGVVGTTAVGTGYYFGACLHDTATPGSYRMTNGTAIPYSTTSPAQSHSLQAPLRALRPAVRTMPFVRESLDLTQRQVTTVADPRHETVGEIRYESDQESFHTFLAAAARFPVTYVPASSNLNDAHECWAIVNDPLDSVMDADRGFPGFEDVSLEIRLRRLDGRPCTGIYG